MTPTLNNFQRNNVYRYALYLYETEYHNNQGMCACLNDSFEHLYPEIHKATLEYYKYIEFMLYESFPEFKKMSIDHCRYQVYWFPLDQTKPRIKILNKLIQQTNEPVFSIQERNKIYKIALAFYKIASDPNQLQYSRCNGMCDAVVHTVQMFDEGHKIIQEIALANNGKIPRDFIQINFPELYEQKPLNIRTIINNHGYWYHTGRIKKRIQILQNCINKTKTTS
jgi:hypothetical protein